MHDLDAKADGVESPGLLVEVDGSISAKHSEA